MRSSIIAHILHLVQSDSNQTLLQRVALGDADAVHETIDHYGDLVWSLARTFTTSDAEAEEAVQDIFVYLWQKADKYNKELGKEVTFVSVIARRRLIDRWRKAKREPLSASVAEHIVASQKPDHVESDEDIIRAREALAELPDDQQTVLFYAIAFGMTHESIAEHTGIPLGTVKTHIRRGLEKIRQRLGANTREVAS